MKAKAESSRISFGGLVPFSVRLSSSAAEVLLDRKFALARARVEGLLGPYEASISRVLEESLAFFTECLEAGKVSSAWRQAFLDLFAGEQERARPYTLSARLTVLAADALETQKRTLTLSAIREGTSRAVCSHGRTFSESLLWWSYCEKNSKIPKGWSDDWLEKMRGVWSASKAEHAHVPVLTETVRHRLAAAAEGKAPSKAGRPRHGEKRPPAKRGRPPKKKV